MFKQDDLALVDGMNKKRLREACRAAGIKNYGKMTTDKMREAVRNHMGRALVAHAAPVMETAFKAPPKTEPELKPVKRSKPKDAAPVVKVEREVRNKIKRPLDPTSKTGQVWAALDELVAKGETDLTTAVHAIGDAKGWNRNNTSCELSAFRKFYGISTNREAA